MKEKASKKAKGEKKEALKAVQTKPNLREWKCNLPAPKLDFCPDCGCLLETPNAFSKTLSCKLCNFSLPVSKLANKVTVTKRRKRKVDNSADNEDDTKTRAKDTRATVNDDCPECGHNRLYFNTAQLRSADEGQTVFFECMKCGYGWSVNT
eukprot:CAMPEP_0177640028 /NCGR_PEP_ID=MMETSP0447-20121125/6329_1 /TAXON_ID=0 /ORGANISM="Stygamoeba regulata, Strain BSH-02190019" /LENGTH=150 /DNA_ID=CAMNT_0019142081 /DNA_START=56 /DNA_END=508 /DNA_ORIENTATION=-